LHYDRAFLDIKIEAGVFFAPVIFSIILI